MTKTNKAQRMFIAALFAICGCGGATEAPRVQASVAVDSNAIGSATTDLGYTVELSEARMAIADMTFAIGGETHSASMIERVGEWVLPTAHAHPGHFEGGEITGELPGRFVVDWLTTAPQDLGLATMIAGTYESANFIFDRGDAALGLDTSDPLLGHTAYFVGQASKDNNTINFAITVDSPQERVLSGVPFRFEIQAAEGTQRIFLALLAIEGTAGLTLFDGLDFAALDTDLDGTVSIVPDDSAVADAYNQFRRNMQTHDFYQATGQP